MRDVTEQDGDASILSSKWRVVAGKMDSGRLFRCNFLSFAFRKKTHAEYDQAHNAQN